MKPYKLKHKPTNLYFQPHKHMGSHLSKNGKIYQTGLNGLSYEFNNNKNVRIICKKDSKIFRDTKDKINWIECSWAKYNMQAVTNINEWKKEEII